MLSILRKIGLTPIAILAIGLWLVACAAPTPTTAPTTAPTSVPTKAAVPTTAPTTAPVATTAPTSAPTTAPTTAATATSAPKATTAPTSAPTGGLRKPEDVALEAAGGQKIGGSVSFLAVWSGTELDNFNAMVKPFQDATGIKIEYTGTRDLAQVIATRVQAGNPPDVVGMPGVGDVQQYAQQGKLIALDNIIDMNKLKQDYDQGWIDLGSYKGKLYGFFTKAAVKSLVWYNPKTFKAAGYQAPKTLDDLLKLDDKIVSDGKTPWCIGLKDVWPGKDWVADLYLQMNGPDMYDKWVNHKIPWTDPSVKNAYLEWGKIIGNDKNQFGGKQGSLATTFDTSPFQLFSNPPGCYMHHQADFITSFILTQFPNLKPGDDFDFFVMPAGNALMTAGDLFAAFKDTPQSRALVRYMTSPEAQAIWAGKGGYLSPNKRVPTSAYPDPITQHVADILVKASAVRFGAGDQLPGAVGAPFSDSIIPFVQNPADLDKLLQKIEDAAKTGQP